MDRRTDHRDEAGLDDAEETHAVPRSVHVASWLLAGVIGVSGVSALLTIVLRDELVRSWAEGNASARTILEEGGIDALDGSEIVPSFVPVALVMFVVLALLGWVLGVFFRTGHTWARWAIAVLVLFAAFTSVVGLNRNLPDAFLALTVVSLVLNAVLLVLLFHRDTNAFLKDV